MASYVIGIDYGTLSGRSVLVAVGCAPGLSAPIMIASRTPSS